MKILKINSSSNRTTSISRKYVNKVANKLLSEHTEATVRERDTAYTNLPFITENMLNALFVKGERTEKQKEVLQVADGLIEEVLNADILVIGAPIYNFSVPASLKAYFDLIARAGRTFTYTENGPQGLLKGKKAYIVIASGGVAVGSDVDFSSKYIQQFLSFIGITDVEIIALDELVKKSDRSFARANKQIEELFQLQTAV
ncbi:FMN-dependent NADH-azoreductase [Bizionia sediminis]|uniref:FMN dependent NADH:quinone oxidoreductase n=1 Tax=Bizionia sediminis TaxID=1737064 RepID=A0ABW5KQS9_9FLAO